ncbi:retrovirus-related pol polyprotein from transposon TNT 1-94 [Tanacetum coccineum]
MSHIIGIEPQFENIIKNVLFVPMVAGQRKPEGQWTADERKAANLDQRLKTKSTWDDLMLYREGPSDVKESRVMDLKLCYNTFKFKEGETLTKTFTIYKALMNELVNDGIKLSKLKINTSFINRLPKKWLSFCQSLRNTNHVNDSELASLFGKLKYEENLIDSIYKTKKKKSLICATPLSTAFFSTFIVQDFQDSPNDEEDTRSSQEYLTDLEEKYQVIALLAKSKRFFKMGTQRFNNAKATDQTKCHKCGKKGHFARDYWLKTSNPSYQSPLHPKPLSSSQHQPEIRPTKDFEAKYNKIKAKLAHLSSSASDSKASMVKNKGLIAEAYEWDEEEVSSDEDEMVEVKVLMALAEDNNAVSKEGARNGEWVKISMRKKRILGIDQLTEEPSSFEQKDLVFVKFSIDDTKVSIPGVERPWLSEAEGFTLPNHDTGRILPAKSQRNTTNPPIAVTDSSATDYDSVDESSVCSTPLPPLKKLDGAEPVSGPKTNKSILRGNKSPPALKVNSTLAGKLKSVKIKDDPPLAIVIKELNNLKLQISMNQSSYSRNNQPQQCERIDHGTCDHAEYLSTMNMSNHLKNQGGSSSRSRTLGPSKHCFPPCIQCEALQAKKAEALKSTKVESSNANRSKTLTKSYLHKYVEQSRPKVVFGDDSTCTTEGYGSIKCNGIVFTKFDEKRGTIFNSNKEVVMIALRVRDAYVFDMTSSAQESCLFAKAYENLNWLWHKRLAHLNFKTINNLAKQNLVIGLPSLVYSKDKPCSSCEKGKHHRASFKTKHTSSIKKYLHLLYMDLFGPITPRSINHEKYTLVIVDEYSRCHVFIHNNKDHLGKFEEKADDGYFLGYSLVSKAFRVFNTGRQQTKETYHITFDESPDAIKFTKPSVDNINIGESERYPPDEYLHPYEPYQRYQTNNSKVSFIEPYESLELVFLETKVSSNQYGQTDQNDQSAQTDEILNDDQYEHSNHPNDENIIDNLPNTEDI